MQRFVARLIFVPTLLWNMLLGRVLRLRNWWDQVDDDVFIGALPLPRDVPRLAEEGVRAVVNTCKEYQGPVEQYRQYDIEQLRIPTVDFTPPKLSDVQQAVEFMDQNIAAGKKIYVHCKAGRARSGTVVVCWLIKNHGLTPEQAQRWLLEKRPHANPRLAQRPVVREFARQLKQSDCDPADTDPRGME